MFQGVTDAEGQTSQTSQTARTIRSGLLNGLLPNQVCLSPYVGLLMIFPEGNWLVRTKRKWKERKLAELQVKREKTRIYKREDFLTGAGQSATPNNLEVLVYFFGI